MPRTSGSARSPVSPGAPGDVTPGALAKRSDDELLADAAVTGREIAAGFGRFALELGEIARREAWRRDGATSLEAWIEARTGASASSARALAHMAERLFELPVLASGLCGGACSFDQARAVAEVATPESDARWCAAAQAHSVRELAELARAERARIAARDGADAHGAGAGAPGHGARRWLRFHETCATLSAQLAPEDFAAVRARLEAHAGALPSDGETPLDVRLADAFVALVGAPSGTAPHDVPAACLVAHVPLSALMAGAKAPRALAAHLEAGGLLDTETLAKVACDATVVLGVDDEEGHTMYEGRQRRFPSDTQRRELWRRDRHCRFPGCAHRRFAQPHHIRRWSLEGGPTDLENLVLLCVHHHHLVHSKAWAVRGDANEALRFVGPSGREMLSRPSPLWTMASQGAGP